MWRGLIVASVMCTACSAVESTYVRAGYDAKTPDAVKRIAIVAWALPDHPKLGDVLRQVTADRVQLKMQYLVYRVELIDTEWRAVCGPLGAEGEGALEGVLAVQAIDVKLAGEDIELRLVAELHRCADGELLWRAEGFEGTESKDDDLTKLTESYQTKLGEAAGRYAAPVFLILRDILETLPDPVLTDDEIMEKIELS